MKKIRLALEYRCYPLWIYQDDQLIDNDLPKELADDKWLIERLEALQEQYDGLFEDNSTRFTYRGFSSELEKNIYLNEFEKLADYLKVKLGTEYVIENRIRD